MHVCLMQKYPWHWKVPLGGCSGVFHTFDRQILTGFDSASGGLK